MSDLNDATELITWLQAQLDEDERVALAATKFRWDHPDDAPWRSAQRILDAGVPSKPQAMIARFAIPQRALAEVVAKRAILDAHLAPGADPHPGEPCTDSITYDPQGVHYDDGYCERHVIANRHRYHTDLVPRLLALPFADRDGYRPEWAPDQA